ncbi:uncharacterized protein F5891DRAFT_992697 [Suillus fuscotomentosus]|uniref:Uncharacterized protein n=1 Tax=Suillus fuscotomentosus TaxID=1912939 RepID=A0AAD4ELF7_9AGAM|nr:uncharacterized protein F5891DRAFT_992697 [Suillus fuscotomentosus]KAG1908363.1 hypothetical protein F5891DRAFT_992697 [Suillus fuscotomentosus]
MSSGSCTVSIFSSPATATLAKQAIFFFSMFISPNPNLTVHPKRILAYSLVQVLSHTCPLSTVTVFSALFFVNLKFEIEFILILLVPRMQRTSVETNSDGAHLRQQDIGTRYFDVFEDFTAAKYAMHK